MSRQQTANYDKIVQALLHNPGILIVDEPAAGLDPEERIRFRNLLSDFADNRIVFLSTHIASDIESACGGVAVLHEGRLIFHGSTGELIQQAEGKVWLITASKEIFFVCFVWGQVISRQKYGS